MLTDKQIQRLKPGLHADQLGLYLHVHATGRRSWIKRTQVGGAQKKTKLGEYPRISLAAARDLNRGAPSTMTMKTALDTYEADLKVRRPEQVKRLIKPLYDFDLDVDTPDLIKALKEKAKTAPVMANRMLNRWQNFFDYCRQYGWLKINPLAGVKTGFIGGEEVSRDRTLSWEEIVVFLRAPLDPDTKFALYTILATGLRPSEALWVLSNKVLHLVPTKEHPGTAKLPAIHSVPRVPHVLALLKKVNKVPSSHLRLSNTLRRIFDGPGMGNLVRFKPHDLRRTFASRLADLGVVPHVIEKLIDHRMQGTMAVYNRAEYWPERVAAMKLWGHKLSRLRKGVC